MPNSRTLLDASNLHIGGGVQVGASVVNEVAEIAISETPLTADMDLTIFVSSEVAADLESTTWSAGLDIRVGDSSIFSWVQLPKRGVLSAVTIFGPYYRPRCAKFEVVGFALGRMIYSLKGVGLPDAGPRELAINRIKWWAFRQADMFVTETEEAGRLAAFHLPKLQRTVIPNCASGAIRDPACWVEPKVLPAILAAKAEGTVVFAAIARDYPHKNLAYLVPLQRELQRELGRPVRFVVTLTEAEWQARGPDFRQACINCGIVTQRELGPLYLACAATVLTSLLEVSSATPFESMHLGRLTFVSDLPAMRSAQGQRTHYFSSRDPQAAAAEIATVLRAEPEPAESPTEPGNPPRDRALAYLEILRRNMDTA